MRILPDVLVFDWDEGNKDKNFIFHRVTNQEAEEVFFSKPNFIFEDIKHSLSERRYMVWGATTRKRTLAVFFTIRKDKIRIISARDMHRKERREYEKIKGHTEI
ncbi:MAG: BrnT family toxin [Elusimicrobia bacterium]|nr:BrnT family toxin [Elusimicrobiota bacterium]